MDIGVVIDELIKGLCSEYNMNIVFLYSRHDRGWVFYCKRTITGTEQKDRVFISDYDLKISEQPEMVVREALLKVKRKFDYENMTALIEHNANCQNYVLKYKADNGEEYTRTEFLRKDVLPEDEHFVLPNKFKITYEDYSVVGVTLEICNEDGDRLAEFRRYFYDCYVFDDAKSKEYVKGYVDGWAKGYQM